MPKRKRKVYNRPRKLYDSARILEENALVNKYGLKNKREVWKADFAVSKMRNAAKKLITAPEDQQEKFLGRQKSKGFNVNALADVLALTKEDYLGRRLQSVLMKKGLARTAKQARQFITHKHVTIDGNIIDSPSHITTVVEESGIGLNISLPVKKELTAEEKEILNEIKEIKEEQKETGEEKE